jgi:putative GTP pyrophosphokinase
MIEDRDESGVDRSPAGEPRPQNDLRALEAQYQREAPRLQLFGDELRRQLERLLVRPDIWLSVPIEYRIKGWESLSRSLDRKSRVLRHVLELNDLLGIRVVLQFPTHVKRVCELIEHNFDVIGRSDTSDRLGEDRFGYASIHFVVTLPASWQSLPGFQGMEGHRAEIQVRTTAQHIWAAASHKLQYKQEASVPPPIRRAFARVAAILEIVDLELERVLEQRADYVSSIPALPPATPLNVDLLQMVLDSVWPWENKKEGAEDYAGLLRQLNDRDVTKRGELESLLHRHRSRALADDAAYVAERQRVAYHPDASRISKGVFFTHVGLTLRALGHEHREDWRPNQEERGSASERLGRMLNVGVSTIEGATFTSSGVRNNDSLFIEVAVGGYIFAAQITVSYWRELDDNQLQSMVVDPLIEQMKSKIARGEYLRRDEYERS